MTPFPWGRVFLRSFWMPALWTVQRGQNLGLVFSLWPAFKRLHPTHDNLVEAAVSHTSFFSTHPYTAGTVLGVVAGLEEDRVNQRGPTIESILSVRTAMAGPLAVLGEAFFWSTWRPLCLVAATAMLWTGSSRFWAPPLLFFVMFNTLHVLVRWVGLRVGHRERTSVVLQLAGLRVHRTLKALAVLGVVGLLVLVAVAARCRFVSPGVYGLTAVFLVLLNLRMSPGLLAGVGFVGAMAWTFWEGGLW